jgi:RNA polymerase sporulation-specific sigma factor
MDIKNKSDEVLVSEYKNGDQQAFNELYSRYNKIIKYYTRNLFLLGAENEDLIQEGMIGLHRAVVDYTESRGASFRSFALLCVHRQIIDAIKQDGRKKNIPLTNYASINIPEDDETAYVYSIEAVGANPEDIFLKKEANDIFLETMKSQLSQLDYKVLELYLSAYSYNDIAQSVEITVKQVDNAIQRIKKKIAKSLNN